MHTAMCHVGGVKYMYMCAHIKASLVTSQIFTHYLYNESTEM